ncbi:tetratricopeptide repeat protein [Aquimarina macrocephali]|uniref:tetratricopeptide repeat protein n=1 Tax=Aquimarina macrocephali TaxID=666563 RepID=UPI000463F30C|nr:hypothetical protein [Aquimarina macrocephali]
MRFSYFFEKNYEKRIVYIDSGIEVVKNTKHVLQTGSMYMTKGIITQEKGDYNKALDYFLVGLEHAKKKNVLVYVSLFRSKIADLKRKLGKYNEAKFLYKQSMQYEKIQIGKRVNDSIRYLMFLSDLIYTYRLNKEIDSAYYFHSIGEKMSQNTDIKDLYILEKGILQYYDKDYNNAILSLKQGIKQFLENKHRASYGYHNLVNGYLFLGKSYNALHQKEIAIDYLKKIDSIVQLSNNLISEARPAYPEIISYYKSINDRDNQLYYINRLLYNDSLFHSRYITTTDKLNSEFDTPILISQKESIIHELKTKNNRSYYVIFITSIVIIIITSILFNSYRKNKRYKKHFDELMVSANNEVKRNNTKINEENTSIGISKDVVEAILKALDKFEKKRWVFRNKYCLWNISQKNKYEF